MAPKEKQLQGKTKSKPSLFTRAKKYFDTERLLTIFGYGKTLAILLPSLLAVIVLFQALLETNVFMLPLRVTSSLESSGYTAETSTQRLLDEISALNKRSNAAKPKTLFSDTSIIDSLSSIETPVGNLDLKSAQSLLKRVFGITPVYVSGEITTTKIDGTEILRLRLRRTPGRDTLIDVETTGGPEVLFRRAALNLLERVDPEIAAGIYFRDFADPQTALRLVEVALNTKEHAGAKKYAWNLKSYIFASQGKLEEAMRFSDEVEKIDPKFAPRYYSKANVLRIQKKYDEALQAMAQAVNIEDAYQGPLMHGLILRDMGNLDAGIAKMREALERNDHFAAAYRLLALTLANAGRTDEALQELFIATAILPDNQQLQFQYAELLEKQKRSREAIEAYSRAAALQPDSLRFQVALADALAKAGRQAEAVKVTADVRKLVESGANAPEPIMTRASSLITQFPAPPSSQKTASSGKKEDDD